MSALESAHGDSTEYDLSVIHDAPAVKLQDAPACVLTVEGDTAGPTAFYVYFPQQDQSFADSLG